MMGQELSLNVAAAERHAHSQVCYHSLAYHQGKDSLPTIPYSVQVRELVILNLIGD